MRFSIYQDSALGGRSINQDRMGYCYTREALLMVVADGMGGHARGEVAADVTVRTLGALFQRDAKGRIADPRGFLDLSLRAAHHEILRYQSALQLPEAPRTTVVACVVQDERAWWAHAGDARLYWLRGNRIQSRTRDHSRVQNLLELGLITPKEQETHPDRNKVLNCLGSPFEPIVEVTNGVRLEPGDTLLLCSDGLWSGVGEAELVAMLSEVSVDLAVPELVHRAVVAQGASADNTTALAMVWEGERPGGVSSREVPEGAMTTTIGLGAPEGQGDQGEAASDITDEEIERTIQEIRQAIQKTGAREPGRAARPAVPEDP